jgi:hypothetical protein
MGTGRWEVSIGCDDYYVALAFRRSEHNGDIVVWFSGLARRTKERIVAEKVEIR